MGQADLLLGIDIGTTNAAAVIADSTGQVLADASFTHQADLPALSGRSEQDVSALLAATNRAVAHLPASLRQRVGAIGVTGQMHGVILADAGLKPISPLITWQDQRCLERPEFLTELAERTGQALHTGYGCATLAWLAENRLLPPQAAAACTTHDLLVARLCGLKRPLTDPTDAAAWGLFDIFSRQWLESSAAAAGIPQNLLSEVRPCGQAAGRLVAGMAQSLGLPAGVPVAVAIGDNQASLLATLQESDLEIALTLGTGGQASVVLPDGQDRPAFDPNSSFEFRPFPGQRILVVAAAMCGGSAWAWLVHSAQGWLKDLGIPALDEEQLYAHVDELGLRAQDELDVQPQFLAERHDPTLLGSIAGINLDNFQIGPLARGLARGIIRNLKEMLPPDVLQGRQTVVGSGNALRRSHLLRQMAQEVFDLPLVLSHGREEAATGAAINAAGLLKPQ